MGSPLGQTQPVNDLMKMVTLAKIVVMGHGLGLLFRADLGHEDGVLVMAKPNHYGSRDQQNGPLDGCFMSDKFCRFSQ